MKKSETDLFIKSKESILYPWRISVRKVGSEYWVLASMNRGNLSRPPMFLFFFRSRDLPEWEGYNKPILTPSSGEFGLGYTNTEEIVDAISRLFTNKNVWDITSRKSIERAKNLTFENFMNRFYELVKKI